MGGSQRFNIQFAFLWGQLISPEQHLLLLYNCNSFLKVFYLFLMCWVFISAQAFSSCGDGNYSLAEEWKCRACHCGGFCGRAQAQGTWASAAAEQGHSCSAARRVSPGQGQHWCALHREARSQPLDPQRNPRTASSYLFPQENKLPSQHSSHRLISSTCFSVFYRVPWLHPELVPRKLLTCNFWRTLKY